MQRISAASGFRSGLTRYRWVLTAVIAAVLILVAVLVILDSVISRKTLLVQNRILEEELQRSAVAESGAMEFQRYLDGGARGRHVIDGPALHRFIEMRYDSRIPDSLGHWRIVLQEDKAEVEGVVHLERYLQQMGMDSPAALEPMAGQDVPFGFRGRLESASGRGRFIIEEVTLMGLPLPLELVERVAGSSSENQGSALIQQFPLPGGIAGAMIDGDRVVINGGQP